jgi:CRISPR-associated exonuclease Cas4
LIEQRIFSMEYDEDDFLQLSGIQHFLYCRRQWALIHVENQWAENERTMDGNFFHKNAHNGLQRERRGDLLIVRSMYIHSRELGISGQCDIVEFHRSDHGVSLNDTEGLWIPYPIEYKRGHKKPDIYDEAQVCAQAICLEEMYFCQIPEGAIFYGEDRRRERIIFSEELRRKVRDTVSAMHDVYRRGVTPKAHRRKGCNACSLKDICLPELESSATVEQYMKSLLKDR